MKCQFYKSKTALPLLCLGGMFLGFIFFNVAQADVCFLPMGGCVERDVLSAPENCAGYSTQKKNERGWNCATCNANGHTYYKCEEKTCGAGYTAGIESCARGFTHEYEKDADGKYVYSGDKKCGKCTTPDGCADGTQLSPVCEQSGFKPVETQNYKGAQVCYACLDDNCYGGKRKYCSWSSGSQSGPSGSVRAKSREWYTSTARTKYGSTCYQCCDNVCSRGSQEVTSCNPNTELLRTLEHTKCGSACNECCNNVCSVGSLSSSCPSGEYSTTSGSTKCGNTCYSCVDCGGYKEKPSGCYSCTPRTCGGETRYDCTVLSDSCPSGSKSVSCASYETETHVSTTDCGSLCYTCKCTDDSCSSGELNPSCAYGKSNAGKTHCSNKQCYTCNECTDTCSDYDASTSQTCGSGLKAEDTGSKTQCGNTCYRCVCDETALFASEENCKKDSNGQEYSCQKDSVTGCYSRGDALCTDTCSKHGWKASSSECSYGANDKTICDGATTCYECKSCTDTCSKHGWKASSSECSYGANDKTICDGNTKCYECKPKPECTDTCSAKGLKDSESECSYGATPQTICDGTKTCYECKPKPECTDTCAKHGWKASSSECSYGANDKTICDGNTKCYECKSCTDTCAKHGWKASSSECSYGANDKTICDGNTKCYECKANRVYTFEFDSDSTVELNSSSSYVEVISYVNSYDNQVGFTYSCIGDFDIDKSQSAWDKSNNEFSFVTTKIPSAGEKAICTLIQDESGKTLTLTLKGACPSGWQSTACPSDSIQTDYSNGCYKCGYTKCYIDADELDIDGYIVTFSLDGISCDDGVNRSTPDNVTFDFNMTRHIHQCNGNDATTALKSSWSITIPKFSSGTGLSNAQISGTVYGSASYSYADFMKEKPQYYECSYNYLLPARWWCCASSCGLNMQTDYACSNQCEYCYYETDSVSASYGSGFNHDRNGYYSFDGGKKIYWEILYDDVPQ